MPDCTGTPNSWPITDRHIAAATDRRVLMNAKPGAQNKWLENRPELAVVLIWLGVLMIAGRWFEIWPLAELSWWWVLSPLIVALVWFEVLEPLLGFDKRNKEGIDREAAQREARVRERFGLNAKPAARRPDAQR